MNRRLFWIILMLLTLLNVAVSIAGAQQYQTQTAPLYVANSKYLNGTSAGYAPTKGAGLTLNLSSGRSRCANTMVNYAGGTLSLTNNTTNYVYLDTSASCVPAFNTSGYSATTIEVATVVTSGGVITTITDDRTLGMATASAGTSITGGSCTNQVTTAISTSGVPTCTTVTSAYVNNSIALTGTDINTSNQVTATHLSAPLPIAQGGTNAATAAAALVNLIPAGTRVGDMLYCSAYSAGACTAWTLVAGNNSGTQYLQETSGGIPSWTTPSGTGTTTIASGSKALSTSAISSATCTSAQTDTATGVASTDNIQADFNADPTAVTGFIPSTSGMLTIIKYPTTNTVNFKVCNNTGSSITPGAITLNWRVVR